ncbi:MAG: hypothetical protein KKC18_13955, partial [Chloroflexi bacterium]|nr:hypothetical protein [Chloroflexota bacterium]
MMVNNYGSTGTLDPNTFALVQIHWNDDYASTWGNARGSFYGVGGTPDGFIDGVTELSGSYQNITQDYNRYRNAYLVRMGVTTDVTIELSGDFVSGQTYEVQANVCVEAGGPERTLRIYMVQVLDHWPASPTYSRNGFKQAADTLGSEPDITLAGGECETIVREFTFDASSWANQADIKIIAWAQVPGSPWPKEAYQAAVMTWPFPPGVPHGACCHPGQSCTVETEADCTAGGWTYFGDGTDCSPNPCIPDTGACCYTDGSCLYILHITCDTTGGTYLGDLVECDPNPCPQPTGGCCHSDGSCTIETEDDCITAGGAYEGDDTLCTPNPCPQPTGACCQAGGSCTIETPADCATAGGTYWGNDTSCVPTPCPQVRGACCLPPLYTSCIFVTPSGCDVYSGIYRGDDVPCSPTNPCPPPMGACCHPDGSCTEEPQVACAAGGWFYQGEGTVCTP